MDFIPRAQPHQFRNVPGPSRSRQNTTTPLTDLPSRFSTWSNDSEFNSGETRYRDDNSNDRKAGLGKLEQDALEDERWANRHEEFLHSQVKARNAQRSRRRLCGGVALLIVAVIALVVILTPVIAVQRQHARQAALLRERVDNASMVVGTTLALSTTALQDVVSSDSSPVQSALPVSLTTSPSTTSSSTLPTQSLSSTVPASVATPTSPNATNVTSLSTILSPHFVPVTEIAYITMIVDLTTTVTINSTVSSTRTQVITSTSTATPSSTPVSSNSYSYSDSSTATATSSSGQSSTSPSAVNVNQTYTNAFATFFYQNSTQGNCGAWHSDDDMVVAMDTRMYDSANYCGRSVLIRRADDGASVIATVADSCPTCQTVTSLDLSVAAFNKIATLDEGDVPIHWIFIS